MIFEITKPIIAMLHVECNSKEDAIIWVNKIVVSVENENGKPISSNKFRYFEAETINSEIKIIEKLNV